MVKTIIIIILALYLVQLAITCYVQQSTIEQLIQTVRVQRQVIKQYELDYEKD